MKFLKWVHKKKKKKSKSNLVACRTAECYSRSKISIYNNKPKNSSPVAYGLKCPLLNETSCMQVLHKNPNFRESYKMPIYSRADNYLNIMVIPPIFTELLALMWEVLPWVLVAKFPLVLELRAVEFESTKNFHFQICNSKTTWARKT